MTSGIKYLSKILPNSKIINSDIKINSEFDLYYLPEKKIYIHFINIDSRLSQLPVLFFQKHSIDFMKNGRNIVHLWEDKCIHQSQQIKDRFNSLLEINDRVYARNCKVQRIDKIQFDSFIDQHHLMNTAKVKFKYGLYNQHELMSVMGISAGRWMTKEGAKRKSFEIIRYATKANYTIVGGFTKFLKYIEDDLAVDEWMSYMDLDWAINGIYQKNNFNFKNYSQVQTSYIHKISLKRYSELEYINLNLNLSDEFYKVYNAGSMKLIKAV